ncbi:MAG: hypothetical protein J5640_03750 [Bacteroidales bacterium]|nr:hypothetical protein [Bacteroidales bacterium]
MKTLVTFDQPRRSYRTPQVEIAELPLDTTLCMSGDLVDIEEEDGGIVWS